MVVDGIMEAVGGDEIKAMDGDVEVKVGEEDVNVGKKKPKVRKRVLKVTIHRRWMVQSEGKEWGLAQQRGIHCSNKGKGQHWTFQITLRTATRHIFGFQYP